MNIACETNYNKIITNIKYFLLLAVISSNYLS